MKLWDKGWAFYYIPRSSLNPHGTYAIVAAEDMQNEASMRYHIAELTGFGDGALSGKRKTPEEVYLIRAAPDLYEACEKALELLEPFDDPELSLGLGERALTPLRQALTKARGENQ